MIGSGPAPLLDACNDVPGSCHPSFHFVGDLETGGLSLAAPPAAGPSSTALSSPDPFLSGDGLGLCDLDQELLLDMSEAGDADLLPHPSPLAASACRWDAFPTIPEDAELQMLVPLAAAAPRRDAEPLQPELQELKMLPGSPISALDAMAWPFSGSATPTEQAPAGGLRGVPRVASAPDLSSSTLHAPPMGAWAGGQAASSSFGLRRRAAANRAMPRSRSAGDVADLANVPHLGYLTPQHLRKGKGGRQPAADPRLDPRIDPKKARRILANRLSAAKSKLKQKSEGPDAGPGRG